MAAPQRADIYRVARSVEQFEPDLELGRAVGADFVAIGIVGDAWCRERRIENAVLVIGRGDDWSPDILRWQRRRDLVEVCRRGIGRRQWPELVKRAYRLAGDIVGIVTEEVVQHLKLRTAGRPPGETI